MPLAAAFSPLETEVSTAFAGVLTAGQCRALSAWVAGTVVAGSACESMVAGALQLTLRLGEEPAVRARLREFVRDGWEHAAPGRAQVEPGVCFGPLLRWVLRAWPGSDLALALDATSHRDRLSAVVVSVLVCGRAIPVAWHLQPARTPGPWLEPALELLDALAPVVQAAGLRRVLVAADRGLWSPRLADRLQALGWLPLLRVQADVSVWLGRGQRVAAQRLVAGPGHAWVGRVTVHKHRDRRRVQTVLVLWLTSQPAPWVLFTTLPVAEAATALLWYRLRMWIEAGFRDLKRLGWQWERTRRTLPTRVARHWLVLAVATLWVLRHGGDPPAAATLPPPRRPPHGLSAFQRGRFRLLGLLLQPDPAPPPPLPVPVWPIPPPGLALTIWSHPPYLHPDPVNLPL